MLAFLSKLLSWLYILSCIEQVIPFLEDWANLAVIVASTSVKIASLLRRWNSSRDCGRTIRDQLFEQFLQYTSTPRCRSQKDYPFSMHSTENSDRMASKSVQPLLFLWCVFLRKFCRPRLPIYVHAHLNTCIHTCILRTVSHAHRPGLLSEVQTATTW